MARFDARKAAQDAKDKRRQQLCAAAAAVNGSTDKRVLRHYAKVYGVPKETLRRYCQRIPAWHQNRVFTEAQEEEIQDIVINRAEKFLGMTRTEVKELAFAFAKVYKIKCPLTWHKEEKAGEDWLLGFFDRHPQLSCRRSESISVNRARGFRFGAVQKFYDNVAHVINAFSIPPERVYNADETAVFTSPTHQPPVVAAKGARNVGHLTSAERGQLTTALCAFNCDGESVPPLFIFNRARMDPTLLVGAPPGSVGFANPGGWICTKYFIRYLTHFAYWTNASRSNPVLLILDNHSSHRVAATAVVARSLGVHLVTLPPHTSHKLQPCDVGVYGPLKVYHNQALNGWMVAHPGWPVTLANIMPIFAWAYAHAASPKNCASAFRSTGIVPFNGNKFKGTAVHIMCACRVLCACPVCCYRLIRLFLFPTCCMLCSRGFFAGGRGLIPSCRSQLTATRGCN
eukprot:GHVU01083898.1.p2 GENE.GHVU01083898.1~~GHVU01083898.1.p2  ORF type:complete len:456 (-),score=33.50 GHVU01083898.1:2594-3961(-)